MKMSDSKRKSNSNVFADQEAGEAAPKKQFKTKGVEELKKKKKKTQAEQKQKSGTSIGDFFVHLAAAKKKNYEENSNLENYAFGFDVPKKVANNLKKTDTHSDSENDKTNYYFVDSDGYLVTDDNDIDSDDEIMTLNENGGKSFAKKHLPMKKSLKRSATSILRLDSSSKFKKQRTIPLSEQKQVNMRSSCPSDLNENFEYEDDEDLLINQSTEQSKWIEVKKKDEHGNDLFTPPWKPRKNTLCQMLFESGMFDLHAFTEDRTQV